MNSPDATVLITTRNRRDELSLALASARQQVGIKLEILVIDDGSTDGSVEMVKTEFPSVRLQCSEKSRGYIVRRNEGARLASAPYIFSIDDDATFSSPNVVEQTLADFSSSRIGAVAIPFIEPRKENRLMQQAPDNWDIWATDRFIGTAHAVRRDIFLKLGGYREHFVHQGEESDFCIRLLEEGRIVRLGRSNPILHKESVKRDTRRMDFYGRRNDVLFALHNVSALDLPLHLAGTLVNGVRAALHSNYPGRQMAGLTTGLWEGIRGWRRDRHPVTREIYQLQRRLKKNGPLPLAEIEHLLPPILS